MIENDIKLHTDYLIAAIESSEDIETLEETVNEIKEIEQKLQPIVIDLISGSEPGPENTENIMSREHSRLKIEIKQNLKLFRKHVKKKKTPLLQTSSVGLSLNYKENVETHNHMTTPCHNYNNAALMLSLTLLFGLVPTLKAIRQRPLRIRVWSVMVILQPVVPLYLSKTLHSTQNLRYQLQCITAIVLNFSLRISLN